jgi:hypothetical protein
MSVFTSILKVLGIGKKDEEEKDSQPASTTRKTAGYTRKSPSTSSGDRYRLSRSKDKPMVDVVSKLEEMAAANPEKLNWKVSIVDLLKLLGMDSSSSARAELAEELDIPAEMTEDSARMNIWLHKTVMREVAENGGNVPQELLD